MIEGDIGALWHPNPKQEEDTTTYDFKVYQVEIPKEPPYGPAPKVSNLNRHGVLERKWRNPIILSSWAHQSFFCRHCNMSHESLHEIATGLQLTLCFLLNISLVTQCGITNSARLCDLSSLNNAFKNTWPKPRSLKNR